MAESGLTEPYICNVARRKNMTNVGHVICIDPVARFPSVTPVVIPAGNKAAVQFINRNIYEYGQIKKRRQICPRRFVEQEIIAFDHQKAG